MHSLYLQVRTFSLVIAIENAYHLKPKPLTRHHHRLREPAMSHIRRIAHQNKTML